MAETRYYSLVDDHHIDLFQNVTRRLERPNRLETPVMRRDRPWEDMLFFNGTWSVRRSLDGDGMVAWYENWDFDVRKANHRHAEFTESGGRFRFSSPDFSRMEICVGTSTDGITWEKPLVGSAKGDHARTNVVLGGEDFGNAHAFSVVPDPVGGCYRALFVHEPRRPGSTAAIRSATSIDGFTWHVDPHLPTFGSCGPHLGDVLNLSYHDTAGFLLFTRHPRQIVRDERFAAVQNRESFFPPHSIGDFGSSRRRIWLTTSTDFSNWTEPEEILVPDRLVDNLDDAYYSLAHLYDGDAHIGFLSVLHEVDDQVVVELVTSRDLREWHRVAPGVPFLSVVSDSAWEAGTVNVCSPPVEVGKEWYVFYGATPYRHDWWWVGEREGLQTNERHLDRGEYFLGLARVGKRRLAGLYAGMRPGVVVTHPLPPNAVDVRLNVRVDSGGAATAAVLSEDGAICPGLSFDDCRVVTGDDTDEPVVWKDGRAPASLGSPWRLAIRLHRATLFGFSVASTPRDGGAP